MFLEATQRTFSRNVNSSRVNSLIGFPSPPLIATERREEKNQPRGRSKANICENSPLTQDTERCLQVEEHEREAQDPVVDAEVLLFPRQPQPHEDGRQGRQEGEDDDRFLGFECQHGGGRGSTGKAD